MMDHIAEAFVLLSCLLFITVCYAVTLFDRITELEILAELPLSVELQKVTARLEKVTKCLGGAWKMEHRYNQAYTRGAKELRALGEKHDDLWQEHRTLKLKHADLLAERKRNKPMEIERHIWLALHCAYGPKTLPPGNYVEECVEEHVETNTVLSVNSTENWRRGSF